MRQGRLGDQLRALLPVVLLAAGAARAPAADPPGEVVYRDDRVSARVRDVGLEDVLAAIAARAGAELRGRPKEPRPVTVELDAVPIAEALHRLLGNQNFTLVYGDHGRLKAIRLHGGPVGSVAPAVPATPSPAAKPGSEKTPDSPFGVIAMLDQHAPVPLSGPLSTALGTTEASFRDLFKAATQQEDQAIRDQASRVMLNGIESDPTLKQGVVKGLAAVDDPTLASLVRAAAGDRAQEFLTKIMTQARSHEFKIRAATLLQQVR